MFLVFLGVAGAIAAVGVVDDMVADIEDDVRAEAEKWLPRASDEAGAGDLLVEAVGAEGADLAGAPSGNDAAEARAVASAEEGPVVAEVPPEVPEDVEPKQSLENILAEVLAEEAAAETDLWIGAAAWAEDAALEEDQMPVTEGAQGEGEDVAVEAVVLEGSWGAAKTEPVADENTQEQVEEVNEVVPVERVTQVARTSEPEAAEEQLMVADARIYEVIETVSGLSLEDVIGQGTMEAVAA
ncbi:hypothetical protein [Shimia sp. MIT1388]|uniref:hypothetical protein n=1 Tax=Shimia sp. MIT1388 TaxID=3096992 RepID=UPI00399B0CA5